MGGKESNNQCTTMGEMKCNGKKKEKEVVGIGVDVGVFGQ